MIRVDAVAGIALMVVGMLLLASAAASDLLHVGQDRWYSAPALVAPVGLLVLLAGGVLAAD